MSASIVEGKGPFTCTDGSHEEFKTNDLKEFNQHLLQHSYYGRASCAVCDKAVDIPEDKPVPNGKKPVCDDCRKEITG